MINEDDKRLTETLAAMRNDEVTTVVRSDALIKKVGLLLLDKHGTKQSNYVSQKMRELARLLQVLTKGKESTKTLEEYIKPQR